VEKVVDGLARAGEIVRVKELLFDAAAHRGITEKLVGFLKERGEVTVPEFKEMTGLSRKYLIPLLEHFDATKVTLRVGDKRVLRKGK
jgi:selenocysteine-specific elongation factor